MLMFTPSGRGACSVIEFFFFLLFSLRLVLPKGNRRIAQSDEYSVKTDFKIQLSIYLVIAQILLAWREHIYSSVQFQLLIIN